MMELYLRKNQIFYADNDEFEGITGHSYEITERIGSGGNGVVYKCLDSSGSEFAVKILLHSDDKSRKRFMQEIDLMKKINHNHVVKYIDEGLIGIKEKKNGVENVKMPFVIMELAETNLLDYIKNNRKIDYSQYVPQFRGLCEALNELHRYAIHRDIKPENILIKGEKWILSDFGLCEFLNPEERIDVTGRFEKIGPIYWISPEAVNYAYFNTDRIGTYSDVYQMGMLFAFVLLRRYPGGIIRDDDSLNTTAEIRNVIIDSISNNYNKRPKDGESLLTLFNRATINKDE